jgi:hypothetical protein
VKGLWRKFRHLPGRTEENPRNSTSAPLEISEVAHLSNHYPTKAYSGSWCIPLYILNLNSRLKRLITFTPRSAYHPEETHRYPMDSSLDWLWHRSWCEDEENNPAPVGNLIPIELIISRKRETFYHGAELLGVKVLSWGGGGEGTCMRGWLSEAWLAELLRE